MSTAGFKASICGGPLTRREMLRVGGLGLLGLSLPQLLALKSRAASAPVVTGGFGRAKSCILLYLSGGPPQHEAQGASRRARLPKQTVLKNGSMASNAGHCLPASNNQLLVSASKARRRQGSLPEWAETPQAAQGPSLEPGPSGEMHKNNTREYETKNYPWLLPSV